MQFSRIDPSKALRDLVECYWIVEHDDPATVIQKIIPDGFTEIIFHFGDSYEINLDDRWVLQPRNLLAGQISRYFHLRNTGTSGILGIKFRPAALTHLFNISMRDLTDRVVDVRDWIPDHASHWENALHSVTDYRERIALLETSLVALHIRDVLQQPIEKALDSIFRTKGSITVGDMCHEAGVQERQLERLFRKYIGLSPKFFARVIRFSTIFQVVNEKEWNGSALGLESGFYDQSHFIRNFKAFTGEDPSRYFFDEKSLANFFLKKE